MRLTAFLYYTLVILGIAGVAASHFGGGNVPKGFYHFGVGLIGAGIALGGLESVMRRRLGFRLSEDGYNDYDGVPAFIVGLMTLLIGAAVIGAAYLHAEGRWQSTIDMLLRRPGPVLLAAGFLFAGLGTLFLFNPGGREGTAYLVLVRLPKALIGLVLLIGGFGFAALGAWEFAQPQAFDRFVRTMPPPLVWLAK
jgi:hypothetical protein